MQAVALDPSDDSNVRDTSRTIKTRVLIVSDHPSESRDVATNLRKLHLDVQLCLFDGSTLSSIPTRAPDAVLCHLVEYPSRAPKLAKVIRSHYKSIPLPLVGALSHPSPDSSVGFDSTLFAPMHASHLHGSQSAMRAWEQRVLNQIQPMNPVMGETAPRPAVAGWICSGTG